MALFTTLYSGSSGNCGLVREGNQYLLVDMGKSCRTTLTALRRLDLAISDCAGILVTHEHSDHVAGLDTFLKKYPIPVYSSADTLDALDSRGTLPPAVETSAMDGGNPFDIGPFKVSSFPTSHDVPCCGYRIETPDGRRMALATDLGILTPVVQDSLLGCDPRRAGGQLRRFQPARRAVSLLLKAAHRQRPRPSGQQGLRCRDSGPHSGGLQKVCAVPFEPDQQFAGAGADHSVQCAAGRRYPAGA